MADCFQENFSTVSEFYIEVGDKRKARKEFRHIECIDEIIDYAAGTDGNPVVGIPIDEGSWYYPKKGHEYWPSYLSLLRSEPPLGKGFPKKAVKSVDTATNRIMSHIFDPNEPSHQTSYGLVVGYVQSGKTANFTALIAKAADSGYKINTVGVGSKNGSLIPITSKNGRLTEYKRDNKGKLITSTLNESILKEISIAGNGTFFWFNNNQDSYLDIAADIESMEKKTISTHEFSEYEDRYQFFATMALLFLIIGFVMPTRSGMKN
mgnify:CR=1 FL=1